MRTVLDTAFLIKCLKSFKMPNSEGHLNVQQQWTFKCKTAVGI
jgi:hypothetical protein